MANKMKNRLNSNSTSKSAFKIKIPESTLNYYTDIYSHLFCPFVEDISSGSGEILVVGTSHSELIIIANESKSSDEFLPNLVTRISLPKTNHPEPILGLDWGSNKNQIFAQTPKSIYKIQLSSDSGSEASLSSPEVEVICTKNINSFTCLRNGTKLCVATDDGNKVEILDLATGKVVMEFGAGTGTGTGVAEVCKAKNEFIGVGGTQYVNLYDSNLRSREPVTTFDFGAGTMVNNLAISSTSTWIAISTSNTLIMPNVYNITTGGVQLKPSINEKKCVQQKIYEVHFDPNDMLYWGGSGGNVLVSENLDSITRELKTSFGDGEISNVYSIITQKSNQGNGKIHLSAAGSTNGLILSTNSKFWDTMIHV